MKYRKLFIFILLSFFPFFTFAQKGNFASSSVLASGKWYKIATVQDGVYKLTFLDLLQLGISQPISASNFRLYGNGGAMLPELNSTFRYDDLVENAVMAFDGGDGYINDGDYFLFYGQGTTEWDFIPTIPGFVHQKNYYCDTVYYFLTFDLGPGKRIQNYPEITVAPDITVNKFNEHLYHELDSLNIMRSGKLWYGEVFNDVAEKKFRFVLPDISTSDPLTANINFAVRSIQKSVLTTDINDVLISSDTVAEIDGNVNSDYAKIKTISGGMLPAKDTITIGISYNKPESSSLAWLNYIEVFGVRNLVFHGSLLHFRNIATTGYPVSKFEITNNSPSSARIWNITDKTTISEMHKDTSANQVSFKANTNALEEFVAFSDEQLLQAVLIGCLPNQNLHGSQQADMIILTHPDFISQAMMLADFHRNTDGLTVVVTDIKKVYNEFSSGKQDVTAIRDFVRMFYERGLADTLHQVKYLLLFGDGSFDMKNRLSPNTNFIPVWQTLNSLVPTSSYVSDDFFGMLDASEGENLSGNLDIGVGRFPVSTQSEADIMTKKSMLYGSKTDLVPNSYENGLTSNYDPWRNSLTFIADDEDANLHLRQAEKMVEMVDSLNSIVNIGKIYLDAYKQENTPFGSKYPDVNEAINEQIKKGTLMLNYTGHGGEAGLAAENILTMAEIEQYSNYFNLPVFITATCEFSRYDNPLYVSAGEKILLNPKGGGIAMFSTTRVAYAHSNEVINRNFLKTAFTNIPGEKVRFGDMIKKAKNLCAPGIYMQNFTLLGDPALALALPEYAVITDFCGTDSSHTTIDTVFNSDLVTVRGHIADQSGNPVSDYNGRLYPVVYDKPALYKTLANDPGLSYQTFFSVQLKVLFKGNVTINNGVFEFSFFVPRDINFTDGFGKISYYAKNSLTDAAGVYDSLLLFNNGSSDNPDISGPEIKAYLEDYTFTDGSSTSSDPLLLLHLHDTSGINCYGVGVGHEITAVLDDDYYNVYNLNDLFVQDADSYSSGNVTFKFSDLSYGTHKLTLRAFDLLNNSSEKEIYFNVQSPEDLNIGGVFNYPDPVSGNTTFHIEHNMSKAPIHIKINVYHITGCLAAELNYNIPAGYYKPVEIEWNAGSSSGERLSKGIYTYTVILSDLHGKLRTASDKMVILK